MSLSNEATGDIYVAERGNDRVQWLHPRLDAKNQVEEYEFAGQFTGSSATGNGVLPVTAEGTGTLSIAEGTGALSAAQGEGSVTVGSTEVTGVTTRAGAFVVGQEIETHVPTFPDNFPLGTTITKVGPGNTLTLSTAALPNESDGPGRPPAELQAGSTEVTAVTGVFAAGQELVGAGVPGGTTITAVGSGTLKLSNPVTQAGIGVALSGRSKVLTGVVTTTTGAFAERSDDCG